MTKPAAGVRSAAMSPRRRPLRSPRIALVVSCALSAAASARAQPASPPRPPGARPTLVVTTDEQGNQRLLPLPAPDAAPLGGAPLALRGLDHAYALTNTAAELSPDGALLAFERGGRPFIRHLPSGVELALVRGRIRDVDCRFVGFAPDSRRLAYTLSETQRMEGPPSIFPIPAGVYVATVQVQAPAPGARSPLPTLRVVRNARLPGTDENVSFWSDDGAALLGRARVNDYTEALRRTPVDGGPVTTLHTVRSHLGMIQLHARGDRAVFQYRALDAHNRPTTTSLATLPLAPGAAPAQPRTLVPIRHNNAGPELSPDGALVAYTDRGPDNALQLFVVPIDGASAPRALHPCRFTCDARWESPTSLLLVHGESLLRLRLDGGAPETLVPRGVVTMLVGGGP